ncbi:MAG TPA: hypothetical protein VI408_05825 [Gaiellaceae bacterium]
MIDPLAERFFPLADVDDTGDWLDVRRRARRSQPIVLIVVVAVAAVLAAAALSATNTWKFGTSMGQPTAERTVLLHGRPYTLRMSVIDGTGRFFALLLYGGGPHAEELTAWYGGPFFRPSAAQIASPGVHGPATVAINYRKGDGEIWYGDARPDVRRVVIYDPRGRGFAADTVQPPKQLVTRFRFWAIALDSTYGRSIVAYDADGRVVERRRLFTLMAAG